MSKIAHFLLCHGQCSRKLALLNFVMATQASYHISYTISYSVCPQIQGAELSFSLLTSVLLAIARLGGQYGEVFWQGQLVQPYWRVGHSQ